MDLSNNSSQEITTNHWEQFDAFRKKLNESGELQQQQHFKQKSYASMKDNDSIIQKSSYESEKSFPLESQHLRELIFKQKQVGVEPDVHEGCQKQILTLQEKYEKQIRQLKLKYEDENTELVNRLSAFTDELEELKKNYKDKNMKLYNLVLQLEKVVRENSFFIFFVVQEKQDLIDKNITLLEMKADNNASSKNEVLLAKQIKEQQNQIKQFEQNNSKLVQEKVELERKLTEAQHYQQSQLENDSKLENSKHFRERNYICTVKPPIHQTIKIQPTEQTGSSIQMSFDQYNEEIHGLSSNRMDKKNSISKSSIINKQLATPFQSHQHSSGKENNKAKQNSSSRKNLLVAENPKLRRSLTNSNLDSVRSSKANKLSEKKNCNNERLKTNQVSQKKNTSQLKPKLQAPKAKKEKIEKKKILTQAKK